MKAIHKILLFSLLTIAINQAFADAPVVINNNNTNNQPPQSGSNCNNNQASKKKEVRPGTYYQSNPQGGMDTVYTTGDKTPYVVDNNNCNQPMVQPYVYGVQPGPPGPPGPRGR